MQVGMQLYSLCPMIDDGKLEEAVRTACASGIDGLELYSLYHIPAITYRKLMNEYGVVCCGTHNYWASLRDDLDHVMEYNYVLGNKNVICHYLLEEERGSRDNYLRVAESLNEIGAKLKANGFDLVYHNHDFEFREVFDGKPGMELLLENTDPFLVGMELHIGQLPPFGYDIPEYIRKVGRRLKLMHVHAFLDWGVPFDSQAGLDTGKTLDVPWAVLENVYPLEHCGVDTLRADVDALRKMIRKQA